MNVVREDPERRGLLYAGTELGMYVTFNDGDSWQSLQLNLPIASVRDISIRNNDLVVATHGRAFWILDNLSPLREAGPDVASENVHLFKPQTAFRVRPGTDQATPFPADVPHGENPPSGGILDYYLRSPSAGPVLLEIVDAANKVIRRYSSEDKAPVVNEKSLEFPAYWVKSPPALSKSAGMHRFLWDLHYAGRVVPNAEDGPATTGPWAQPGEYRVRLTVNGKVLEQPLMLKMDPRVKASAEDLRQQFEAAQTAGNALEKTMRAVNQASAMEKRITEIKKNLAAKPDALAALSEFEGRLAEVSGPPSPGYGSPVMHVETDRTSLRYLTNVFTTLISAIQSADGAPTKEQQTALAQNSATMDATLARWNLILTRDLTKLNQQLKAAGVAEVALPSGE